MHEFPYDVDKVVVRRGKISGIHVSNNDFMVKVYLDGDLYVTHEGQVVFYDVLENDVENINDAIVVAERFLKMIKKRGERIYLNDELVAVDTNEYFISECRKSDCEEIKESIDWSVVENGWKFVHEVFECRKYNYYVKNFGRLKLKMAEVIDFSEKCECYRAYLETANYMGFVLPYSDLLVDGMDLKEYLRALPML